MIAGGSQIRGWDNIRASDYVYVDDAVDALVRAGHAPVQITGTCDIGTGTPTRCLWSGLPWLISRTGSPGRSVG